MIQENFTYDGNKLYCDFKWINYLHMNNSMINIHVINRKLERKKNTIYLRSKYDIFANNYFCLPTKLFYTLQKVV